MAKEILRPSEVVARTGLSRTTIWRRVRDGTFPAPHELGPNSIGWPASAIDDWLDNCPRRTYGSDTVTQTFGAASKATP